MCLQGQEQRWVLRHCWGRGRGLGSATASRGGPRGVRGSFRVPQSPGSRLACPLHGTGPPRGRPHGRGPRSSPSDPPAWNPEFKQTTECVHRTCLCGLRAGAWAGHRVSKEMLSGQEERGRAGEGQGDGRPPGGSWWTREPFSPLQSKNVEQPLKQHPETGDKAPDLASPGTLPTPGHRVSRQPGRKPPGGLLTPL